MKNKKGFTLIELLAVIVILAILVTIAVPSAMNISNRLKTKMFCSKMDYIENAAKLYGEDRKEGFTAKFQGYNSKVIRVSDLINNNYLKKDNKTSPYIEDPRNKKSLDDLLLMIYIKNNTVNVSFNNIDKTISDSCQKNSHEIASDNTNLEVKITSNVYSITGSYIYTKTDTNSADILSKLNITNDNAYIKERKLIVENILGEVIKSYDLVNISSSVITNFEHPIMGGSSIADFLTSINSATGTDLYIIRHEGGIEKRLTTGTFNSGDKLVIYYRGERLDEISLNIRW